MKLSECEFCSPMSQQALHNTQVAARDRLCHLKIQPPYVFAYFSYFACFCSFQPKCSFWFLCSTSPKQKLSHSILHDHRSSQWRPTVSFTMASLRWTWKEDSTRASCSDFYIIWLYFLMSPLWVWFWSHTVGAILHMSASYLFKPHCDIKFISTTLNGYVVTIEWQ